VDKLSNEPRDLQYGKFIYDAISKIYNESNINDPRVRELFFAELYKISDDEFFPFIENAINDELKPLQKKWAIDTMKDIAKDLGKDDTGLEDLDEEQEPIQEIMTMKQAIAAAAVLLGTAGAPNMAQAQDKTQPATTQQDTTNTATATYAHPNENTARSQSAIKAKAALAIKIGKPEGTISASIVDSKMYKLPDGRYECITTVKLN
jgi:hypothetical protein